VSALLVLGLGGVVGLGVLLVIAGLAGRRALPEARIGGRVVQGGRRPGHLLLRVALVGAGAVAVVLATGWLAAGLLVLLAGLALPHALGGRGRHQAELDRVEAIAAWSEMVRDTMAGANGLEQAIAGSAPVAPAAIAPEVGRLAARLDRVGLSRALRQFADEVDHPTADFVVAGLVTAAEREARELGPLLTQLAECARDEAQMRARVWAGRARTRTSVRVISASVVLFALGLVLFDRGYLEPYDSVGGQVVLLAIGSIFACSIVVMDRMGRIELPERFVGRRVAPEPS